ncbi:ABC transporter ATP-binding protein [Candidatus Desulforudis audaxviator]|uniref:Daunorubicin resistance ABC transporter ATPase subunit n=1 Tax=Desulforudis audaxviator (strain MP104C) TaxID=477974 RepID=B1I3V0_DESAP|nr:ATP-binding cassette domain-containing protein [Candidatus Desulforudis audaxviator]ACA59718.1 daunorubicin resistance ABC transporter ATPase subunit [Candidatus Desulforudis audaxviator MP104C]AZK59712.1 ABC transporter ATP-binding protein [Candidatus Desulforudis audaxviator]
MIEIKGLTKDYGRIRAVDDLHLRIEQGEIFGLLGPNGAGKTTTVRMLTMLARPTAGEAYIAGCEVQRDLARVRQEIGVVPQHMNLDQELTARENLELHGRLYKMPAAERRKRVEELLFFVDLQEREGELVSRFSGGMKRRLMIARALMHRPRVLFLDEPTVGLDPQTRRRMWDLVRQMNRDGVTVLLTTHYIEEAEALCHRVGIMDRGRLIALGSPVELKERVGRFAVESLNGGQTTHTLFGTREEALAFAGRLDDGVVIRETSLEDVFVQLTGRRVGG